MRRASGVSTTQTASNIGGLVSVSAPSSFPSPLNLYPSPPSQDITIDIFEQLSTGRLHILRAIETGLTKGLRDEDLIQIVRRAQEKFLPLHSNESSAAFHVEEERNNDEISHWLLRLAFATSADSTRWFITHEFQLFKLRFAMCSLKERGEFIRMAQLPYERVSDEDKGRLFGLLKGSTAHSRSIEEEDFIKVPWTHVLDLVSKRHVLLDNGTAFVPTSDLFSVISSVYRNKLEAEMDRMSKLLIASPLDERIKSLLDVVRNSEYEKATNTNLLSGKKSEITATDIESASSHFPPCMLSMHDYLKSEKHLKYNGRQQMGLFLKSIGLPFNEALLFWKRAFSKFSDDEFNKNYAYNVRHNYGLEGKRANYGCMNCKQIISGPQPSTSDHSGCPFRHSNSESLAKLLQSGYSLNEAQVKEITELARSGHYQAACTRVLESSKLSASKDNDPIVSPTQFYEASLATVIKK